MKDNSRKHILLPFLLALVIMTSFIVPAASIESYAYTGTSAEEDEAVPDAVSDAPWYDSIPDLLAAGEYEEGVVIAGIDMSRAKTPWIRAPLLMQANSAPAPKNSSMSIPKTLTRSRISFHGFSSSKTACPPNMMTESASLRSGAAI